MNSAAAFMALDGSADFKGGVEFAQKVIKRGAALEALNRVRS
jgi:anthranilate phosphoribosyltransferase